MKALGQGRAKTKSGLTPKALIHKVPHLPDTMRFLVRRDPDRGKAYQDCIKATLLYGRTKDKDGPKGLASTVPKKFHCQGYPPTYMRLDPIMEKRHGQLALLHDNFVWVLQNCAHFLLKFL